MEAPQNELRRGVGDRQTVLSVRRVGVNPPLADTDSSSLLRGATETTPIREQHVSTNETIFLASMFIWDLSIHLPVYLSIRLSVILSIYILIPDDLALICIK